jgi:tryptophan synthase alpha chain
MTMNRIDNLFLTKKKNILSIYFTAGFPLIGSTIEILHNLYKAGVDMVEIGIPFSDPLADGPVIQNSNVKALRNGMSLNLLFEQLTDIRREIQIPLILMGYINPIFKFGIVEFCRKCHNIEIDGVIIPDLPLEIYLDQYQIIFKKYNLHNILLISPQTCAERVRMIDKISRGFIYMVSSSSTTGIKGGFSDEQRSYFRKIREMNLGNPRLIGFGISDAVSFNEACKIAEGVVIGSAFIKLIEEKGAGYESIQGFIDVIRGNPKAK